MVGPAVAGALVVIGVAAVTLTNATNSLMQLTTEPSMRGRVMALRIGIALGGTPVGAPTVGWIADNVGPRWALGVGAASGFAAASIAAGFLFTRSAPVEAEPAGDAESSSDEDRAARRRDRWLAAESGRSD